MIKVELQKCPLCGGGKFTELYRLDSPVVQCNQCSLAFLNPQPRVEHQTFYDESYYRGSSEKKLDEDNENVLEGETVQRRLESCQAVIDRVMQFHSKPGKWLDIGCGPGFLLSQAKEKGWQCTGLDSSPFAPKFAKEQFGLEDVHTGLIENVDFDATQFDVISMQHVIEHLYEPVPTMKAILKLLKPGGILYLETPDINSTPAKRDGASWLHIKIPEHVLYFSQVTLRRLLDDLSCEVLDIQKPVPGTGVMHKLFGGEEGAKRFYNIAKKVPLFNQSVRMVRSLQQKRNPDLADHVQVLARKKNR